MSVGEREVRVGDGVVDGRPGDDRLPRRPVVVETRERPVEVRQVSATCHPTAPRERRIVVVDHRFTCQVQSIVSSDQPFASQRRRIASSIRRTVSTDQTLTPQPHGTVSSEKPFTSQRHGTVSSEKTFAWCCDWIVSPDHGSEVPRPGRLEVLRCAR